MPAVRTAPWSADSRSPRGSTAPTLSTREGRLDHEDDGRAEAELEEKLVEHEENLERFLERLERPWLGAKDRPSPLTPDT
jgi:hypothetical protein